MTPKTAEKLRIQKGIDRGTKLRRIRVEKGLSQSQLSKLAGIPIQTLRRYEQNVHKIDDVKLKTVIVLCECLGCRIGDIIESEELLHKYRATK